MNKLQAIYTPHVRADNPCEYPAPDLYEVNNSLQLVEEIQRTIRSEKQASISFAHFMEMCLYSPGLGYYTSSSHKFGESGDFYTAPEISPLFGQSIAQQCAEIIPALSNPSILEIGAGNGTLAAPLLHELATQDLLPHKYYILELSSELKARQKAALELAVPEYSDHIVWIDSLNDCLGELIIIANEVLDAIPVHAFRIEDGVIKERRVGIENQHLAWKLVPAEGELLRAIRREINALQLPLPGIFQSEINLMIPAWLKQLDRVMSRGVAIFIDYGHCSDQYYSPARADGTLMCHYRNRAHADPFAYPGIQDISSHVNFSSVADAALENGLRPLGFTTQSHFLMGCGITELLERSLLENLSEEAYLDIAQAVKVLTLPDTMGEIFKILCLGKHWDGALRGLALNDLSHTL